MGRAAQPPKLIHYPFGAKAAKRSIETILVENHDNDGTRRLSDENEYLREFPWHLRRGLPILRKASRRKSWHDDDARAVARPKPGRPRMEGRSAARARQHEAYDVRRCGY